MSDANPLLTLRGVTRPDPRLTYIILGVVAAVSAANWFLLPAIQSLIIPDAPGGADGPWVVRPIVACHFGAMAVMTGVALPPILRPIRRAWGRADAPLDTCRIHVAGGRLTGTVIVVWGLLLMLVYALAFVFYLFSWTTIGPQGIQERLPWITRNHSFQDITWLETIPDGEWNSNLKKGGPWYAIRLKNGRSITLSLDNEGMTADELAAMTTSIADRSGLAWKRRTDSHPR